MPSISLVKADEQAEFGDAPDLAFDQGARRMGRGKCRPGIFGALLQTEADAALVGIDLQHLNLDVLAGRNDLSRARRFS